MRGVARLRGQSGSDTPFGGITRIRFKGSSNSRTSQPSGSPAICEARLRPWRSKSIASELSVNRYLLFGIIASRLFVCLPRNLAAIFHRPWIPQLWRPPARAGRATGCNVSLLAA